MRTTTSISSHPSFQAYRSALQNFATLNVTHETGIRSAFQTLLQTLAGEAGMTLVTEQVVEGTKVRPDGTLRDIYNLPRGYWEAKDTKDDLETEILKKKRKGYPFTNILFEDTQKAILFQNQKRVFEADLHDAMQTATLLHAFLAWQEPDPTSFDNAITRFGEVIPDLARGLIERIEKERVESSAFAAAFNRLLELCIDTLNPQVQPGVVVEMLAQHLLTERLFRTIFDNPDFVQRNVIAHRVEETIKVMMARSFNRSDFTKTLDRYYYPIESKARETTDWEQKQTFLNDLYERFFQDFSKKAADTQGIVYTPQSIVNFMLESVDSLLRSELGTSLSHDGVVILDPCVGTGNFMQNIVRRLSPMSLKKKYQHELFCNENMLLPYYIACLNIEHAYYERAGSYEPFTGLCFTDTLMLKNSFIPNESGTFDYFDEENAERVKAQQAAKITVIIGNPPYNVGQMNENDNNKNRVHSEVAKRLVATYVKDSKATNKNSVWDMYVRFFRWATDRLNGQDGIIAFVSNNGFLRGIAFDGMRKWLADEFTDIYHVDLGGNARSGGGGSVFSIRVGVGITFLVRKGKQVNAKIRYYALDDNQNSHYKLDAIAKLGTISNISWEEVKPDKAHNWLNDGIQSSYEEFLPMQDQIFEIHGRGIATCRDDIVYDFQNTALEKRIPQFIDKYNAEVDRWTSLPIPEKNRTLQKVDEFVDYSYIKWSESLKLNLKRGIKTQYSKSKIRNAIYRPFCYKHLYFDSVLIERRYQQPVSFPNIGSELENIALVVSDRGHRSSFSVLAVKILPDLHLLASVDAYQCFPLYTYHEDGTNRRENITDEAITTFNVHYDATITKKEVFAYIYALLHHPEYITHYTENLKRELPRIPLVGTAETFYDLVLAGEDLIKLHTNYETVEEYPLTDEYDPQATLADIFHVEKMRLIDERRAIRINNYLTLRGIPPEAHEYTLGNRSALDWIIDQYRVKGDSNPNRPDEPEYIVRLVKRIITVSVKTVKIVSGFPALSLQ